MPSAKADLRVIKAAGVSIYAVAFEVTDPTIQGILRGCATSVSYYYDASTIATK
jgi:hypothetical protein